jgi:hypothetical protein
MEGGGEREGKEREEMGRAKQSKTNMVASTLSPFMSTHVYTPIIHICPSTIQINLCLHINLCATYSHSSLTIGHHTSDILLPTIHINSCLHSHHSCLHFYHSHQHSCHLCQHFYHSHQLTSALLPFTLTHIPKLKYYHHPWWLIILRYTEILIQWDLLAWSLETWTF